MADSGLTGSATAVVEQYLVRLGARLGGGARARAGVLAEIRDGLDAAIVARTDEGVPPAQATDAAIAELGSPELVGAAIAGELGIRQARRILWGYLASGPLVGIWWLFVLVPRPWHPSLPILVTAIPVLPLIAAAVAIGVVVLATTGTLIRWLPETAPRRAIIATVIVAVCAVVGDLALLGILGVRAATDTVDAPVVLILAAVMASTLRLAVSAWIIPRCVTTHRRLVRG
jgi:hypothetical protein